MNTVQQGRQADPHSCQQMQGSRALVRAPNNCCFSQEACTCSQSHTLRHVLLPRRKQDSAPSAPPPEEAGKTQASEDAFLPALTEGSCSQPRRGWTRVSPSLTRSSCARSCRFLQLFVNGEDERDLMWGRERMAPGEKPPDPGGSAPHKGLS